MAWHGMAMAQLAILSEDTHDGEFALRTREGQGGFSSGCLDPD